MTTTTSASNMGRSISDISNISPAPIFQIATGFWAAKALMAAVELEVFTKLSGKNVSTRQLQDILGLQERPAEVYAASLASLGLLDVTMTNDGEPRYSNSNLADIFLDKNKSSYVGDFISMIEKREYLMWDKLTECLMKNQPAGGHGEEIFDQAKEGKAREQMQKFTHAMYGVSVGPAMALPKNFDFSKYRKMMDIGGGSGVYSIMVVKENPNMSATVIDLEPACKVAEEYIRKAAVEDKIETKIMDYWKEPLPSDCDVAFLSHILHEYSEEDCILLLKKTFDSLTKDGVVLVSEWILNDNMAGPASSALLGLNMIIETTEGRNYSFGKISQMLMSAGFKRIEKRPLAAPAELVVGYKQ